MTRILSPRHFTIALLAIVLLMGGALLVQHIGGAEAADDPGAVDTTSSAPRVLPTGTYLHVTSGTGTAISGGRREIAFSCDTGDELLSGGFSSIDNGTSVMGNRPSNKRTWRLTWKNDATTDSVSVWIFCGDGIAESSYVLVNKSGTNDDFRLNCPEVGADESIILGGWYGVETTNFVDESSPDDIQSWDLHTEDVGDNHGIKGVCLDFNNLAGQTSEYGYGSGQANQDSYLSVSCDPGEKLVGGGFKNLDTDRGTHLREARPIDSDTFQLRFSNDGTRDQVTVTAGCWGP